MNKFNKKQKISIISIICIIAILIIYFYIKDNIKIKNASNLEDLATYEEQNNLNKTENQSGEETGEGNKNNENNEETNKNDNAQNQENSSDEITVHITGAVNKEGVYKLKKESRVQDAVEIAGGLKEDADTKRINLAYQLEDGMKIIVPSINDENLEEELITTEIGKNAGETSTGTSSGSSTDTSTTQNAKTSSKVNINTANEEELDTLPGIGEATARKIIEYRNENGKFSSIEDIKNVKGIGESKFEEIRDLICV